MHCGVTKSTDGTVSVVKFEGGTRRGPRNNRKKPRMDHICIGTIGETHCKENGIMSKCLKNLLFKDHPKDPCHADEDLKTCCFMFKIVKLISIDPLIIFNKIYIGLQCRVIE